MIFEDISQHNRQTNLVIT